MDTSFGPVDKAIIVSASTPRGNYTPKDLHKVDILPKK